VELIQSRAKFCPHTLELMDAKLPQTKF